MESDFDIAHVVGV